MKQICYCSSTSFSATVSVLIAGSNSEVSDTNTSNSELIHSFSVYIPLKCSFMNCSGIRNGLPGSGKIYLVGG